MRNVTITQCMSNPNYNSFRSSSHANVYKITLFGLSRKRKLYLGLKSGKYHSKDKLLSCVLVDIQYVYYCSIHSSKMHALKRYAKITFLKQI